MLKRAQAMSRSRTGGRGPTEQEDLEAAIAASLAVSVPVEAPASNEGDGTRTGGDDAAAATMTLADAIGDPVLNEAPTPTKGATHRRTDAPSASAPPTQAVGLTNG